MSSPDFCFLEFVRLFNDEKFFEAHEVLEGLWRQTKSKDRDFYQGLIQVAAAFVHVQKKNSAGAADLYAKASRHLSSYPRGFQGIDCIKLLEDAAACLRDGTSFPKLPQELS